MSTESFFKESYTETDQEVSEAVKQEYARQSGQIELIASENIVSKAVMLAQGNLMTNKYAEGYPGKRYYGGCEHVDIVEELAIDRAKKLFGCEYANVQPHSGSQANQAVFQNIAGDHRQQRRAAAFSDREVRGHGNEALVPNLAIVRHHRGKPIRSHERMRHPPQLALQLTERLGHPTREGQVVELPKDPSIILPQTLH